MGPGGWRDPDTGAPADDPPPWPPERFDAEPFARLAAVVQERVAVLGEVPELVDFLFLADAPDRRGQLAEGDRRGRAGAADPGRRPAAYETCPWDRTSLHEVTLAIAEAVGRKLGKAQAPIRVAVTGRRGACRCSTRWRCSAGRRRAAGWRPRSRRLAPRRLMLLAPLRWALRIAVVVAAVIVLYFAVTLVQVWLTSRQYDPHPAAAILVMGAAQYDCVPSPDLRGAPRPGADALPRGLRPAHRGDRGQAAGGQVHRGRVGRDVPREQRGAGADILEAGGNDSYENMADAAAGSWRPATRRRCS